jgi:hypothetical protein
MLIHTCRAVPCHAYAALCGGHEKSLSERHGRGMAWARRDVNQTGKTQSKPLVARSDRVTAWERHGMCELAFTETGVIYKGDR